jgi:hypothetical protein
MDLSGSRLRQMVVCFEKGNAISGSIMRGISRVAVKLLASQQRLFHVDSCVTPPPQCHHMSLMDFVVSPPGCGRSVSDL